MNRLNKEFIYKGNSIISIETLPDDPHRVLIKQCSKDHKSSRNIQSLETEYEITQSLKTINGVRKVLEKRTVENQPALLLEYIEGETLQEYIARKSHSLQSKLEIAIELTHVLSRVHKQNVIHLSLSSDNILIENKTEKVYIIDFGSAIKQNKNTESKAGSEQQLENLHYISPEQTGKVNRTIDERSDLYSLGVVFYELMTGYKPFEAKERTEIIHQHLTKIPIAPFDISLEIPEILSKIISKLLSKNAENRYQSAGGLQADLEECLNRLKSDKTIETFQLGKSDFFSHLKFPQKLYGRQRELKELESAFEGSWKDTSAMLFVSGYSGTGKTVLINEIRRPVSEKKGFFINGKFDQYLKTTPYTAINHAFALFVSQILAEPERNFREWEDKIKSAVGDIGRVLTDVIPAIQKLIGLQPDVPQLSGQEAENRFNYVFINFLMAIATEEHPLVLFIDDLQWIDAASLRLLKVIDTEFNQPGLLVIGAYRDNEVDNYHQLLDFIKKREERSMQLRLLKLEDLKEQHLEALLSDTLKTGEGIKELEEIIFEKAQGNPFFSRRLLSSFHEEGHIVYDSEINNWVWNIDVIKSATIADNVADLLAKNIAALPEEIRKILTLAACIGNKFDIHTLALISDLTEPEVLKLLTESLSGQYVVGLNNTFEFVHDQVQQAAYQLIDVNNRNKKHLEIGRVIYSNAEEKELDEKIFDIVNHYNRGVELLNDPNEKIQLAKLNLEASRKAKLFSAFASANEYINLSLTLLDENKWQHQYELTLDIFNELIDVCYLTIQYKEVRELFDTILNHVKNTVDSSVANKTMIMTNIAQNKLLEAISIAEVFLEALNVTFDNALDANLSIDELRELPPIENEEKMAVLEILLAVDTPFIYAKPERLPHLIYTMLNIISKYGNSYISGAAYTWYAYLLCFGKQYHEGNLFGRLGVDLLNKYPYPGAASKIMDFQYAYLLHWEIPVHDLIAPLKDYYHVGMEEGNFEWGLYCLINHTFLLWGTGKPLNTYLSEIESSIAICKSKNHEITLLMFLMYAESACNLTGESANKTRLEGKWFSEEKMTSKLEGNDMLLVLFELIKVTHNYLFGKVEEAYLSVDKLLQYQASLNPHYLYTKISFYGGLSTIGSLAKSENDEDRQDRLKKFEQFEEDLKLWAEVAPMNYQHQYDLVMAEKLRVADEKWNAVQLYEAAIIGAKKNRFIHDEALATELFGRFWMQHGNETIAETYIQKAHQLYQQWGANAKVDQLEQSYPQYFNKQASSKVRGIVLNTTGEDISTTAYITPKQLDIEQITAASQALSSETNLGTLLEKMMKLVLLNSGAEKVIFFLKKDEEWYIEALGNSGSDQYDLLQHEPFDCNKSNLELIPESIFNYCSRTRENLVIGNAMLDDRFSKDKTVQTKSIKSMACIPIIGQGNLKGLIYLENSTIYDVFTSDRMEVLKHLTSQFSISVENSMLYDNLNDKIKELEASEVRFRLVVENANETIVVAQDNIVKYSNQKVEELTGYSMEEVSKLGFETFVHPDDLNVVLSNYQARLTGEKPTNKYSIRIITKEGSLKYVYVSSTLVDWDDNPAVLAMLTDITEQEQTRENLEQSENYFRSLMEQSPLAKVIYNSKGKIIQYNTAWKHLWGFNDEEANFVKSSLNILSDEHSENKGLIPLINRAFEGEQVILPPIEYNVKQKADKIGLHVLKEKKAWYNAI